MPKWQNAEHTEADIHGTRRKLSIKFYYIHGRSKETHEPELFFLDELAFFCVKARNSVS